MMRVNVDFSGLSTLGPQYEAQIKRAAEVATSELAAATHAHLLEEAALRLHSRREMFVDGLSFTHEDGVWLISLDAKVGWIESGMDPHSMLPDLLKSPKAKFAKDGSKYVVVPMKQGPGKGPTNSTPAQQDLTSTVKAHMKANDIPWAKVERHPDGTAKQGLLHKFNIMNNPLKTHDGPGQGWGKVGDVRQGATGIPFLQGVRVYQRDVKDAKTGKIKTERSVMTFRVASSKHEAQGRWQHPGLPPALLFDEAYRWAGDHLDSVIVPRVWQEISGL